MHVPHPNDTSGGGGGIRLLAALFLNLGMTIAEIVGGLLSGSLALLSDAVHNLGDTLSLGVSYFARSYSKKRADHVSTFGYKRIEVLAAFLNLIVLGVLSLLLIKESIERALDPQPIRGGLMLAVAVAGLAANLISALLLHRDARESLNIRSAYLHILSDAASSVGVVIAGVLILRLDWVLADPIVTLAISAVILYQVYHLIRESANILMNSAPPDIEVAQVERAMEEVALVRNIHHVHVWSMHERSVALEAHVVIDSSEAEAMTRIKDQLKSVLEQRFGITHSTLEFEFEQCQPPPECR